MQELKQDEYVFVNAIYIIAYIIIPFSKKIRNDTCNTKFEILRCLPSSVTHPRSLIT